MIVTLCSAYQPDTLSLNCNFLKRPRYRGLLTRNALMLIGRTAEYPIFPPDEKKLVYIEIVDIRINCCFLFPSLTCPLPHTDRGENKLDLSKQLYKKLGAVGTGKNLT